MSKNEPTFNVDGFLGLRNREQPRRMKVGSLTIAENVDIDDMGGVVKREGYISSLPLTDVTSAFCTKDERRMFIVSDGELSVINNINLNPTVIKTEVDKGYIHWLEIADFILMSTGEIIDKDNNTSSWQIPNPLLPTVVKSSGILYKGQYQLVYTYVDALGREGGASDVTVIDVTDLSGLIITPVYLAGHSIKLYISDVDGKELYLQGTYISGSINVNKTNDLVYPIDEVQLKAHDVPSNIECIAFHDSSLWLSSFYNGNTTLFQSEPFWWNLFDLQKEHLMIPGQVNMIVGINEGLVIGTNDEIYIYTNDSNLVKLAEYGVPTGKPFCMDDGNTLFVHSNQGLCVASPFKNLTEDKVSLPAGDSNHVSFVEKDGFKKIVILTDGIGTEDNKL